MGRFREVNEAARGEQHRVVSESGPSVDRAGRLVGRDAADLGRIMQATRGLRELAAAGVLDREALRTLDQWVRSGARGSTGYAMWDSLFGIQPDRLDLVGGVRRSNLGPTETAGNRGPRLDWRDFESSEEQGSRDPLGLAESLVTQGPGTNDVAGSSWIEDFLALFGISLGNSIDGGVREDYRQTGDVERAWVPDRGPRTDAGHMDAGVWVDEVRDAGPDDGSAAIEQFIATYGIGAGQNIHRWDNPPRRPIRYVRPAEDPRGGADRAPTLVPLPLADQPFLRGGLGSRTRAELRRRLEDRLAQIQGPVDGRGKPGRV